MHTNKPTVGFAALQYSFQELQLEKGEDESELLVSPRLSGAGHILHQTIPLHPFGRWGKSHFPMQDHFCKDKKTTSKQNVFVSVNVIVSECYCNITTIKNAGAKGYWE